MTHLFALLLLPLLISCSDLTATAKNDLPPTNSDFHAAPNNDQPPAKVLVYSIGSGFSHVNFMGRVADVLAEAGMDVTTLVSILRDGVGDGTTKSKVVHIDANKEAFEMWNTKSPGDVGNVFRGASDDVSGIIAMTAHLRDTFALQCKHALTKTDLLEQLRKEKYDVVLAENFDYCGFGLAKVIGAKTVVTVSTSSISDHLSWITGTPTPFSWMQSSFSGGVDRSISSRVRNLVAFAANYYFNSQKADGATAVFRERFGQGFPGVEEIIANSSLIVTASDPLVDIARPTQRKIVDIGAIGVRDSKPLDEEYDKLLNLRPRTVILSFGSVAKSIGLPEEYKTAIADAFSRFPQVTFLWKYEEPEKAAHVNGIPNIIVRKWMPQNDLLVDIIVITVRWEHHGVPVIMVPLFADQPRNAAIAKKLGFGFIFEKNDLANADKIEAALREILENDKYATAAKRVAATIRARPFTAKELLVKHVEFTARFGNVAALDQDGLDYPLYIYWNLDIAALAIMILLSTVGLSLFCLRRLFCSSKTPIPSSKKLN
ncbi:hypothetical protein PRIPAC_90928 [Pristionchus pacificus]|uniref:glucuronosyltransferase n=1 Tax=Pristionchus pacificus TaxID=54126 RepID=A0A2A6CXB1_PRIPA|nr:hypothetical protein PRIPAC_90928 [Pristionchus pacificus]|eukprot:PDM82687.1 glucuronosyltransferase [Pristionchus pacificus]